MNDAIRLREALIAFHSCMTSATAELGRAIGGDPYHPLSGADRYFSNYWPHRPDQRGAFEFSTEGHPDNQPGMDPRLGFSAHAEVLRKMGWTLSRHAGGDPGEQVSWTCALLNEVFKLSGPNDVDVVVGLYRLVQAKSKWVNDLVTTIVKLGWIPDEPVHHDSAPCVTWTFRRGGYQITKSGDYSIRILEDILRELENTQKLGRPVGAREHPSEFTIGTAVTLNDEFAASPDYRDATALLHPGKIYVVQSLGATLADRGDLLQLHGIGAVYWDASLFKRHTPDDTAGSAADPQ